MVRISEAPLDPFQKRTATRFSTAIEARTGCHSCYNVRTRGLFLYYGDKPDHGPMEIPFNKDGGWKLNQHDIDDTVLALNMGRRPAEVKDADAKREEAKQKDRAEQDQEAFLAERRPDVKAEAVRLDRKRRGTSSVSVCI